MRLELQSKVRSGRLLNKLQMMDREQIVKFVTSCQHNCGGFGASIEHDLPGV